ncbi:hypothetical protein BJ508DRAFT_367491 [Ascobolus immersus RN42]|uniref:Actin-like ATPase domain-containing protein n=1 Tax=Ascobolus immersus RN42 TaxID=1160509 RepID=A0A3N4HQT3_ASCIM|nr:hypothetical protein BJ508DRAFT_367491 [Ascobolus immersus RN42]
MEDHHHESTGIPIPDQGTERLQLAIAIDFGTSYSGIAYIDSKRTYREAPEVLTSWKGKPDMVLSKVPTIIAYPKDDKAGLPILWGYEALGRSEDDPRSEDIPRFKLDDYIRYSNFKLRLPCHGSDSDGAEPDPDWHNYEDVDPERSAGGRSAEEVTRDYLNLLFEHFEESIVDLEPDYSSIGCDYHILLTVPATFTKRTLRVFESILRRTIMANRTNSDMTIHLQAGSYREPEAASMYTFFELSNTSRMAEGKLNINDCFVICDAGGGTVDVCSYKTNGDIDISNSQYPFTLTPVTEPEAKFGGSAMIDFGFKSFVLMRYGHLAVQEMTELEMNTFLQEFISRKEAFVDSQYTETDYQNIPLPRTLRILFPNERGFLKISRSKMREFFARSVRCTTELLLSQFYSMCDIPQNHIKPSQIKYVYSVGGLGSSEYFRRAVQHCIETADFGRFSHVRVSSPHAPQRAVVSGAARIMHQNMIPTIPSGLPVFQSHLINASYGVLVQTFEGDGKTLIKNQISWFIKKGRYQGDNGPFLKVEKPLARMLSKRMAVNDTVFYCKADPGILPTCLSELEHLPRHMVIEVCTIESDFTKVSKSDFKATTSEGATSRLSEIFRKLKKVTRSISASQVPTQYSLVMTVNGLRAELFSEFKGQRISKVQELNWQLWNWHDPDSIPGGELPTVES